MKFRPGDKVKFKDEPGMGIVTRIDAKGMVYVETEDGFERPVYPADLMHTEMFSQGEPSVTHTEEEDATGGASAPLSPVQNEEDNAPPVGGEDTAFFVGVVQREEKFAFYLINDSEYDLFFTFGRWEKDGGARLLERGELEAGTKYLLAELLPEGEQLFFVQGLLYAGRRFVPRPPFDKQIPFGVNAIPRAREFRDNPFFDEKAWLISLMPARVTEPQIAEEKKKEILKSKGDMKPQRRKMMIRPGITGHEPVEEVDLHIEEIVEDKEGMSNGEILEVQLARFETALEGAIRNHQKKIVFIHGLGQGKLKNEVRKRLEKRKIPYQDAPFKEYGYGATLVLLK